MNLALLSRAQLERLVFTTNRTLRLVVDAVREKTKPEWAVAKEVEKVLERYDVKIEPFRDRTAVERIGELRAARNAARWDDFDGPAQGGDGDGRDTH